MKKYFLSICLFCGFITLQAQNELVTIDGTTYSVDDFNHLFSKNSHVVLDSEQKDAQKDIDLFIDYKLKVLAAKERQIDTLPTIKKQVKNKKNSLTEQYLYSGDISDHLKKEAYKRLKYERETSHILFKLRDEADTVQAYKKAKEVKQKLEEGADFEEMAKKYSQDLSVEKNKGKIGWVKAFNTSYDFENAVYSLKIGEISDPVKSKHGYHIIKVHQERENEGKVRVAHITITNKGGIINDSILQKKADKVYQKLKEGRSFSDMAKQYSENIKTAKRGGRINPFSKGELKQDKFEEIAFELEKRAFSEPFKINGNWVILKLLDRYPFESYEESKKSIEQKLKTNERNRKVTDSILNKIKNKYEIVEHEPGKEYFKKHIGETDYVNLVKENIPEGKMIEIKEKSKDYHDFSKLIDRFIKMKKESTSAADIDNIYENFKNKFLLDYAKSDIKKNNTSLNTDIQEYEEGLMIYELMNSNIWSKAQTDSTEIHRYYKNNKSDYRSLKTYEAAILSSSSKKPLKKARRQLKKGKSLQEIEKKFPEIIVNSGEFSEGDEQLPKKIKEKGVSPLQKQNGGYIFVQTKKTQKSHPQNFEEVKGKVTADYLDSLEKEFIQKLRSNHTVKINKKGLNLLKKEYE